MEVGSGRRFRGGGAGEAQSVGLWMEGGSDGICMGFLLIIVKGQQYFVGRSAPFGDQT